MSNKRGKWDRVAAQKRILKNGRIDSLTGRGESGSKGCYADKLVSPLSSRKSVSPRKTKPPTLINGPIHILQELSSRYPLVFNPRTKMAHFANIRDWAFETTGRAWDEEHKADLKRRGITTSDLWLRDRKSLTKRYFALKGRFYKELEEQKRKRGLK